MLGRRIHAFLEKKKVPFKWFDSPAFLTPAEWGAGFFKGGKALMGNFYKAQRKRLGLLLEGDEPVGGKWSFDEDNRKKLPKSVTPPLDPDQETGEKELKSLVEEIDRRDAHSGEADFPICTRKSALQWLDEFLQQRFELFRHEDACPSGRFLF